MIRDDHTAAYQRSRSYRDAVDARNVHIVRKAHLVAKGQRRGKPFPRILHDSLQPQTVPRVEVPADTHVREAGQMRVAAIAKAGCAQFARDQAIAETMTSRPRHTGKELRPAIFTRKFKDAAQREGSA